VSDHTINITPEVIHQLSELHSAPKFYAGNLYPGAPSEDIQVSSERAVNAMIDHLRAELQKSPQKAFVISQFLEMLRAFEHGDTEEREQACGYCEQVMDILNIESSDGLLNKWLYDFDPDDEA
jgi:hypothetical protein